LSETIELPEDIEASTAKIFGDTRDVLLTHIRAMTKPWSRMTEDEQRNKIDAFSRAAEDVVRRAVGLVTRQGFDNVPVKLGRFTVDSGNIKGSFEAVYGERSVVALGDHGGRTAVLVLADADDYMGESAPPVVDPDEPEIPLEDRKGGGDTA